MHHTIPILASKAPRCEYLRPQILRPSIEDSLYLHSTLCHGKGRPARKMLTNLTLPCHVSLHSWLAVGLPNSPGMCFEI